MGRKHRANKMQPNNAHALKWLRIVVRMLDRVSPALAARWLARLWFSTRRFKQPNREMKWLQQVQRKSLQTAYGDIALYLWPQQGPTVVLLHGWSGRGMQMGAFAEPLQRAGFQVLAFDAPGHGESPGNSTSIFQIVEVLQQLEQAYGPFYAAVAHSFGGMVLALALAEGLSIQRAVSIGSPVQVEYLMDSYCRLLGVPARTVKRFKQLLERRLGADVYERSSTDRIAHRIDIPLLIIHDNQDAEVPLEQAKLLQRSWRDSRLIVTEGLGHRRILRDPQVIEQAVGYLLDPISP